MTVALQLNDLHYAIVVGIDHYPALTDLTTARHDAEQFHKWLVDPDFGAVPPGNVVHVEASQPVTSLNCVLPTQKQVMDAMLQVQSAVKTAIGSDPDAFERTRLYVFVAGHGIKPFDGGGALLMADATLQLPGYHVDLLKYADWHRTNGLFNEVFVFADCCRVDSECTFGYGPPFGNEPSGRHTTAVLAYATTAGGTAAARLTGGDNARGLFTKALLDALRGGAANKLGEVSLDSIENYIRKCLGAQQSTEFIPERSASVVLKITPAPREVCFRFPASIYGVVRLFHDIGPGRLHPVAGDELVLTLEPGLYQVVPESPSDAAFSTVPFRLPAGEGRFDVQL